MQPLVPKSLEQVQRWFGDVIAHPTAPIMEKEVNDYISSSPTMQPKERILLYRQQYWLRLLQVLAENFPTVVRLFGEIPFQQHLAIPYITEYPPCDWALCQLGKTFPQWIETHYFESDCKIVTTCAEIDWAANQAFWKKKEEPIDFSKYASEKWLDIKIALQPFVRLFHLDRDYFQFRDLFIQESVEHWSTHPFPSLEKGCFYFILYRDPRNLVKYKVLNEGEWHFLSLFNQKHSIQEACDLIEQEQGAVYEQALLEMPRWLQEWSFLEILTKEDRCLGQ